MITLTNTPNNLGIFIKGDYNDLNSLYDSLANYVDFYIDNIILDCNEEDKHSEEKIEGLLRHIVIKVGIRTGFSSFFFITLYRCFIHM